MYRAGIAGGHRFVINMFLFSYSTIIADCDINLITNRANMNNKNTNIMAYSILHYRSMQEFSRYLLCIRAQTFNEWHTLLNESDWKRSITLINIFFLFRFTWRVDVATIPAVCAGALHFTCLAIWKIVIRDILLFHYDGDCLAHIFHMNVCVWLWVRCIDFRFTENVFYCCFDDGWTENATAWHRH